jgi:hypothetical protein
MAAASMVSSVLNPIVSESRERRPTRLKGMSLQSQPDPTTRYLMLLIQLHRVQRGHRVTGGVKHFPQDGRKAIARKEVKTETSVSSTGGGG